MDGRPDYLPPKPPPGYQVFGWCGAMLLLPRDWNLCRYQGNHRRAGLAFADLARPRLFLRWQSRKRRFRKKPADPIGRAAARLLKRFPRARIERISDNAAWILLPTERFLLAANDDRLYELSWPGESAAGDPNNDPLVTSFLHAVAHPFPGYWNVYGAKAVFMPEARWKQISLQPGAPRLMLVYKGMIRLSGAFSMADRLLAESSLREIGGKYLRLSSLPGEWNGDEHLAWFVGRVPRRWLRWFPVTFHFNLMHDMSENRICWELTTSRSFLKIWRP